MIKNKKVLAGTLAAVLVTAAVAGVSINSSYRKAQENKVAQNDVKYEESVDTTAGVKEAQDDQNAAQEPQQVEQPQVQNPVQEDDKKMTEKVPEAVTPKIASRGGSSVQSQASKKTTSQSSTSTTKNVQASKSTVGAVVLDWWSEAQYIFPRGSVARVTDVYTGKSFNIKRTYGTNHADCEALTSSDSQIIKGIWGGWSWVRRPVVVQVNGKRIAASMAAMPHAGLDKYPALQVVNNRSGGYGTGQNLDAVKGNGMDGHFDVHFLNSRTHGTNRVDPQHQAAIKKAVGH